MKHLNDYIGESIFSQTGIGDDAITRRMLPLEMLTAIVDIVIENEWKPDAVEWVRISDGQHISIRMGFAPIQFGMTLDGTKASKICFEKIDTLIRENHKLRNLIKSYQHMSINSIETGDIEPVIVMIYHMSAMVWISVIADAGFIDNNKRDIGYIIQRLQKTGWNGKVKKVNKYK